MACVACVVFCLIWKREGRGEEGLTACRRCLQATRTLIARKLKGLEDIISFSSVHWHMGPKGEFSDKSFEREE